MTKQDIRKAYTDQVAQLLNQGYTIFPDTMGGCQGEIAHIDLTNGSEILRVLLERGLCWDHLDDGFHGDVVTLTVGRAAPDTYVSDNWDGHLWNSQMEHISQIKWLELSGRGEGWYTTEDQGQRIGSLQRERCRRRSTRCREELGTAFKSAALPWLRKQPRMKSCRLEDIERMERYTDRDGRRHFEITARGKRYTIR